MLLFVRLLISVGADNKINVHSNNEKYQTDSQRQGLNFFFSKYNYFRCSKSFDNY